MIRFCQFEKLLYLCSPNQALDLYLQIIENHINNEFKHFKIEKHRYRRAYRCG